MERLAFQIILGVLSLIPLLGLVIGFGPGVAYFLPDGVDVPSSLDSQWRYLSGVYVAVTLAVWWTIPKPEERLAPIRLVCAGIVIGGIGRLISIAVYGLPDDPAMVVGVGIELILVPLLLLWQTRLAAKARG